MVGWKGRERRKGYDGKAGRCEMSEWPESLVRASHPFPLSLSSSFFSFSSCPRLHPLPPTSFPSGGLPRANAWTQSVATSSPRCISHSCAILACFSSAYLPCPCSASICGSAAFSQEQEESEGRRKASWKKRGGEMQNVTYTRRQTMSESRAESRGLALFYVVQQQGMGVTKVFSCPLSPSCVLSLLTWALLPLLQMERKEEEVRG